MSTLTFTGTAQAPHDRHGAAEAPQVEIVLNAEAGVEDKEAARAQLVGLFAAHNVSAHIVLTRSGEEVAAFAQRAAQGPAEVVVAGGGDGTINTVAAALAD